MKNTWFYWFYWFFNEKNMILLLFYWNLRDFIDFLFENIWFHWFCNEKTTIFVVFSGILMICVYFFIVVYSFLNVIFCGFSDFLWIVYWLSLLFIGFLMISKINAYAHLRYIDCLSSKEFPPMRYSIWREGE